MTTSSQQSKARSDRGNGHPLTLKALAELKRLPVAFLAGLDVHDLPGRGVGIPYYGLTYESIATKQRSALRAKDGSYWPRGIPLAAYGQWRLDAARQQRCLHLVEGETDAWVLWYHRLPCLGIPGANAAKVLTAEHLESIDTIYLHQEPDQGGEQFVAGVTGRLRELDYRGAVFVLRLPGGIKDVADLHTQAPERFLERFGKAVTTAVPLDCGNANTDDWEAPIPFHEFPRPPFPVACLPGWLGNYVDALAEFTQTPADLSALLALGVCGAALAQRFRVQARPGWSEATNLYCVVALPPANRKSAVFAEVFAPVKECERALVEEQRPNVAQQASKRRALEARLKHLENKAGKEPNEMERKLLEHQAQETAKELAAFRVPALPQLYADDVTAEKLAGLLAEQGGRMLVASAEGTIFEIAKGRYSEAPNFDVFLKGHSGDLLRVHRVGREAEHVDAPALSLAVAVQPDVIAGLVAETTLRGRGFLARPLYGMPRSRIGQRKVRAVPVSDALRDRYQLKLGALWQAKAGKDGAPHLLTFTPEADDELERFEAWLEPQLAEGKPLEPIAGWAGKLAGAVVRLTGILQLAHAVDEGDHIRLEEHLAISRSVVGAAVTIARDYLLPHARAALGLMGMDQRLEDAQRLVRWLKGEFRESVKSVKGPPLLTQRDLHAQVFGGSRRVEEVEAAIELLAKLHYLRKAQAEAASKGVGRRASLRLEVNPSVLKS